jgi:hypothetical protein
MCGTCRKHGGDKKRDEILSGREKAKRPRSRREDEIKVKLKRKME